MNRDCIETAGWVNGVVWGSAAMFVAVISSCWTELDLDLDPDRALCCRATELHRPARLQTPILPALSLWLAHRLLAP